VGLLVRCSLLPGARRSCARPWIGGHQATFDSEPTGGWSWTDETVWSYTHWAGSQPDNFGNAEHAAHYWVGANARGSV